MTLALLFGTAVLALALVVRYHLGLPGVVSVVVTILLGLPALYLGWVPFKEARRRLDQSLAQIADQLADSLRTQWDNEARMRRLNDPYPLSVSWAAADASLTDTWDSLVKLAASGAGWPPAAPGVTWAAGPSDLAGTGRELADVLARVPTGRLVVLGEPGSGKTMLMVRLVLDLLARRASGIPVPVLVSVASWNPVDEDLRDWLAARLVIDHPALAARPPADRTESTQARALLASGLILPILDGLDEIPEKVRGPAISRINGALRTGQQVVVTCRTQQYRDAVRPPDGPEVTLRAAAAIQLLPLDAEVIRCYLCDDAAGPAARARWAPVLKLLGTKAPAGQALGKPLMVGLARAIYNPRPGELETWHDPADLRSPALADRAAVESVLFDAFIPAAYRQDPSGRWNARDAERWLVFLARHLTYTIDSPDLAWWQLWQAIAIPDVLDSEFSGRLVAWLLGGVGAALGFAAAYGLGLGLWRSLGAGLGAGLVGPYLGLDKMGPYEWYFERFEFERASGEPSRGMRISVFGLVRGLLLGLGFGLVAGLMLLLVLSIGGWLVSGIAGFIAGLSASGVKDLMADRALLDPILPTAVASGLSGAIAAGVMSALILGLESGLKAVPEDLTTAESPKTVLARDRRAALLLIFVAGIVGGGVAGLAGGLGFGLAGALGFGLAGALGVGFFVSGTRTAWPSYMVTIGWLVFRRRLPWSLRSFLDDAHRRGVLRQEGAFFQFRHIDLQYRLATRPYNPGQ